MKNLTLILFTLAILGMNSCTLNENFEKQLEGTWTVITATMDSKITIKRDNEESIIEQKGTSKEADFSLNFNENNSYSMQGSIVMEMDNYSNGEFVNSVELDLFSNSMDFSEEGSWNIVDERIILDNESDHALILEDDQLILRISNPFETTSSGAESSEEFSLEMETEFIFIKQ